MSGAFWRGRRVLVTGHTGFKGAWLCLMLQGLGAEVIGLALAPHTEPSMIGLLSPWDGLEQHIVDIRDAAAVRQAIERIQPEIVLHMAAQALVRPSYADPVGTYATNVMGTVHVLEALRRVPGLLATLVITSDKVYENDGQGKPFAESSVLGGHDPYSNSKACAELAVAAYRASFFAAGAPLATARAGNVIGGGDWSQDRLIPDVVRAVDHGRPVRLRYPEAVRPWQHVLEPLSGYLAMARLLVETPDIVPPAVNFGPDPKSFRTVAQVVERISAEFGGRPGWERDGGDHPPEAKCLTLTADLAASALDWHPRLDLETTLAWTASWYKAHRAGADMRAFSHDQVAHYWELQA